MGITKLELVKGRWDSLDSRRVPSVGNPATEGSKAGRCAGAAAVDDGVEVGGRLTWRPMGGNRLRA